ncbi:MAG: Na+/H+ antiporter NhaA [Polyangiaceae bacterium]
MRAPNDEPVAAERAQPGVWPRVHRLRRRLAGPIERFLAIEAASGIVLLAVALLALAWANSAWAPSYHALWHAPLGVSLGGWHFERALHFWVNDGLMTLFFFVVGLEIRREMHAGELSELKRAALPIAAALGGMLVPAAIYLALNYGRSTARGWGIPMATDIAFAVGVLALLGARVPPALRVLLLALAVIDDVGAIVVIALFYSSGLEPAGFVWVGAGVAAIYVMQGAGVRNALAYVLPSFAVWAGAYEAGIHPTLAGVAVGLLTPIRAWDGEQESPVERLERQLHGSVAYVVMPLFAFANAGVPLGSVSLAGDGIFVFLGVTLGLALGKPIGIVATSLASARTGFTRIPRGAGGPGLIVVGLTGGVGFTMSLFVAGLAFPPGPALETAKLAILVGSTVAGVTGYLVGRAALGSRVPGTAATESEAEASTET